MRESRFIEQYKAKKSQALSAAYTGISNMCGNKEPQLIQTCSVGMSGKPSQELASDPGIVVLIPETSSPVFSGGGVGVLKDNAKGKADREAALESFLPYPTST